VARIGDELVVIARAANQAEGEFLVSLVEAEGVTALLRRAPGFDVSRGAEPAAGLGDQGPNPASSLG
jgi:hypothetical protein